MNPVKKEEAVAYRLMGKDLFPKEITIGDKYSGIEKVKTLEEARFYLVKCVIHSVVNNPDKTYEEMTRVELSNIGYYAGYYDQKTASRVMKMFNTSHPIFGQTYPTPGEAFRMGQELARK